MEPEVDEIGIGRNELVLRFEDMYRGRFLFVKTDVKPI